MNSKDCETIGYILADSRVPDAICERFFRLDERIRTEWEGFCVALGRDDQVMERYQQLMEQRYGTSWALRRDKQGYREAFEEVRREIYGEDYDPSLFK